ncbi:ABC-type spermidine/putrescine transport system permease subunit II [Pseudomonas sp. BIGb0408]|uniref:ABC-type spermidine/putrescine transport system permease subunit II n=1 Tax=Phytopseudomonas flavescens TaxID=29435 RepID=A0A7Z0BS81_9GAMM|nr:MULTISPECIES: hypothetical protein [Pseudomonas]MCW2295062.1 ABC-type spermidine/putrescine transport system permease subunit II [Pseudomonas sp. BIGb0408]NYH75664.1 ABC-type spermidine/putrescine transport system permease subunit II [Pseudomonas flavescens]
MKNKKQWALWLARTLLVSVVMSFFAVFIAALLVLVVRGRGWNLVELIDSSLSFSWRLGTILTAVAVVLVFIGSLSKVKDEKSEEKVTHKE